MTTLTMEKQEVSQKVMDHPVDFGEALQEAITSVGDKFGLYDVMPQPRTNHLRLPGNSIRNTGAARSAVAKRPGRR